MLNLNSYPGYIYHLNIKTIHYLLNQKKRLIPQFQTTNTTQNTLIAS